MREEEAGVPRPRRGSPTWSWQTPANVRSCRRMLLTVNGAPHHVPEGMTVARLVEHLGLAGGPVAVERNREVVPRADHPRTPLTEGDVLEIVHFVGGG